MPAVPNAGFAVHDDDDDEDAALAAALAASVADAGVPFDAGMGMGMDMGGGGAGEFGFGAGSETDMQCQLLACRCLANLMEALPGSAHTLVYHGAVGVLCGKLLEILDIDLAEQTLSTLEKLSEEYPSAIVREGGLQALLGFLDFFGSSSQRTALQAASNCLRNVGSESFGMVQGVWGVVCAALAYADARCVEQAAMCVIRAIESFARVSGGVGYLDQLLADDEGTTVRAIAGLIGPGSVVGAQTQTLLLRGLSTAARVSAKVTMALLERDNRVVDILFTMLTGVTPPNDGVTLAFGDMMVMQTVAQRPKEQVEEVLALICELMPTLPKDGIMDPRTYTERALQKLAKTKAKADRRAARAAGTAPVLPTLVSLPPSASSSSTNVAEMQEPEAAPAAAVSSEAAPPAEVPPPTRTEMLRGRQDIVLRFMRLVVPVLVEVYGASVLVNVRTKCVTGMLKALFFLDADEMAGVLQNVPVAAWAGGVLSSSDRPQLAIGALQLVELLLSKAAPTFRSGFRREGVLHEVELVAERELTTAKVVAPPPPPTPLPLPVDSSSTPVPVPAPAEATQEKEKSASSKPPSDPQDALVVRARIVKFKYLAPDADDADDVLPRLRLLGETLKNPAILVHEAEDMLKIVANAFTGGPQGAALSSFEFVQSGLVDGLLEWATADGYIVDKTTRQKLLLDALTAPPATTDKALVAQPTAFATLVRRLQDSLTRMENFEVVTVGSGLDDARRTSASMLARQVRLRLIPEDGTTVPRGAANIAISIHGLATFQALHDYMRPRIAGVLPFGHSPASAASSLNRMMNSLNALRAAGVPVPASFARVAAAANAAAVAAGSSMSSSAPPALPPISAAAAGSPSSALAEALRRSRRLSERTDRPPTPAAPAAEEAMDVDQAGPEDSPGTPSAAATSAGSVVLAAAEDDDDEIAQEFVDDPFTGDVFQAAEGEGAAADADEKLTNVNVTDDGKDGLNITAQTPHGTRVATPNPAATLASAVLPAPIPTHAASTSAAAASLPSLPVTPSGSIVPRMSYANITRTGPKPNEWHLEFNIEDVPISVETTVYGAVYQHEMRRAAAASTPFAPNNVWSANVVVKYKKVPGPNPTPAPATDADGDVKMKDRFASPPALASLPIEALHTKILRLLKVLNRINAALGDRYFSDSDQRAPLPESAFVNNKLTAKMTRQLEEPMIVASSCLPDWSIDLVQHFPFLFPFTTRYSFLQSTSFGYARLIQRLQAQRNPSDRRDDGFAQLGRIQRQKVRIMRRHMLESAVKVFELYGSSSSILEVEYFEEVGTGLGPTLEFYAMVSREFAGRKLKLWRDADSTKEGPYVDHPLGLFPAPIAPGEEGPDKKRVMQICKTIGQFVGKALLDSRIIDMSFNKVFMKFVLEENVPLTLTTLEQVDRALAQSLAKVQAFSDAKQTIEANGSMSYSEKQTALANVRINKASIDDLSLDFTVPGYNIPLIPNGADTLVNMNNVDTYMVIVLEFLLGEGVASQAKAFREGFSKVFPVSDLQIFTADELVMICGNSDEDWCSETLNESIKADHGFSIDSRAIRDLIAVMSEYDAPTRRDFLQFITGSPKLPIGGFRGLNPPLTVVRKPHESPLKPDDYLPSVMTCVNYLKLPEYSSRPVLAEKLRTAMKEGVGSFHLS
ncbi:hypothetical protein BKA62DRAFT_55845 [Auriculariales sp. MPI-PUGE-AT-0066]|nr:hypothetical protein BKA62DRAFT_55845 [Auriculariales sp. MPI-PUGE-AT-0066]